MKNIILLFSVMAIAMSSCKKLDEFSVENPVLPPQPDPLANFTKYQIPRGAQYALLNTVVAVQYSKLKFEVKFDSSAIYKTIDPLNQDDVNKLYGFSDNNRQHHEFSARIGWRWSNDSLRLFAYTYNNTIRSIKEISTVPIGKIINCSIEIDDDEYIFYVENKKLVMGRESTTPTAKGYRLYPYFGGDELAPHAISIWIKEL